MSMRNENNEENVKAAGINENRKKERSNRKAAKIISGIESNGTESAKRNENVSWKLINERKASDEENENLES